MPTATGGGLWGQRFGHTDIIGRPGSRSLLARVGSPGGRIGRGFPFRSVPGVAQYRIQGVSRDAQGNLLPLCTVILFNALTDLVTGKVISEAGTATFSFPVPDTTTRYYIVYIDSAGTRAGVSLNVFGK